MESKEDKLRRACRIGELDRVKRLADEGADVDSRGPFGGQTPLILAADRDYVDIIQFLLDRGADINKWNQCGSTALHHAAINGHDEIVTLLIEKGADLHVKDKNGDTPIDDATPLDRAKEYNQSSTIVILEAAMKSIKVIYTSSQSLKRNRYRRGNTKVTFKDFNNDIIILSDNDIPDGFEFEGKPTFTLQYIQQCIDHLLNTNHEDDIHADNLHDILAQRHPVIAQRLQHWGMNLFHLIAFFPRELSNDTNDIISSLLTKCPQATTSVDIDGMTPLHHTVINLPKKKISQECHDLLLTRSLPIVVHRAIEAGVNWEYLHPIVMAKVNALTMGDEDSGLVPFMLAAEKCSNEDDNGGGLGSLSMAYELLCLKPDVMKEYDEFNQAKRTLDSSTGPSDGSTKYKTFQSSMQYDTSL